MTVEDDGLRHGGRAAHEIPDHLVVVLNGEGHRPLLAEFGKVLGGIGVHDVGMQGQHRDIALMRLVKLRKKRQLLDAGSAIGGPEVDEHRLAPLFMEMEGGAVQTCDAEIRELVAGLAAERRVRRPILGRRYGRSRLRDFRCLRGGSFTLLNVRVEEIIPQQRDAQNGQRSAPGDFLKLLPPGPGIRLIVRGAACGGYQGKLARLQADCLLIADVHAPGTVDALMVAHMPHVHAAVSHARAAAVAAGRVHLHAHDGELAEQAVDRAQRAEEAAKAPVAEHAGKADDQQDDELAGEEDAQHGEVARVVGVCEQEDRALKGARGTDVLAEARQRHAVGNAVPGRNPHDENRQEDEFEPGECAGDAALFQLRRGELVQQLLNQPQGAEPSADRAAEDQPVEHENAEDVEADLFVRRADGVLERAQRAGPDRAGTGITVEAGDAESLRCGRFALVDLALEKALEMGVIKQGAIELYKPSLGRTVGLPPRSFHIIQGQHTPYKF